MVRSVVETGIQKHGQCAQGGNDDKEPKEEPIQNHSNVLPVICHLHGHTSNTETMGYVDLTDTGGCVLSICE